MSEQDIPNSIDDALASLKAKLNPLVDAALSADSPTAETQEAEVSVEETEATTPAVETEEAPTAEPEQCDGSGDIQTCENKPCCKEPTE